MLFNIFLSKHIAHLLRGLGVTGADLLYLLFHYQNLSVRH